MLQADSEKLRQAWTRAVQSSIATAYRENGDEPAAVSEACVFRTVRVSLNLKRFKLRRLPDHAHHRTGPIPSSCQSRSGPLTLFTRIRVASSEHVSGVDSSAGIDPAAGDVMLVVCRLS